MPLCFGRGLPPEGTISAISPTSLSVQELNGTVRVFALASTAVYFLSGTSTTESGLTVGENVDVVTSHGWEHGGATNTPTANAVFASSPHVVGSIQSVIDNGGGQLSIVVADPQGFWHTILTSSSTLYYAGSSTSSLTAPPLAAGQVIAALGVVDTNHTTLDATQVNVIPPRHTPAPVTTTTGETTSTVMPG